jgi:isoleucyl-tRNA synthetase
MKGFRVPRKWGWDCHGLPIESLIEKKLNLKTKKDILDLGIDVFNTAARNAVMEFAHDWEKYVERIGRWVDFKNSYKTMDNSFIEAVWWGIKRMHEKGLLYEGRKVLMYCTHCETPLAKAEIQMDNTYKDITEEAVVIQFKVLGEDTYILAWTTTPWTLPGNVGLAVNPDVMYEKVLHKGTHFYVAHERKDAVFGEGNYQTVEKMKGSELVGKKYEPLFTVPAVEAHSGKKHEIIAADFVTTTDGTGIVHTAVMYGEDDFKLGQEVGLPMVQLLDQGGHYNAEAPELVRGMFIKKGAKYVMEDLEARGLVFSRAPHTHSYPHCYRCGTPLIYNAVGSWFVNIQKVKETLLTENEQVTWVPEHLKHGRFKHIVENAPDWTVSRNRFWASPLPIWRDAQGKVEVIGSLSELKARTVTRGNTLLIVRHGEAESNLLHVASSSPDNPHQLTDKGREQVRATAALLKGRVIDVMYVSPLVRTKQTADILATELGVPAAHVHIDDRIREYQFGSYDNKPLAEYDAVTKPGVYTREGYTISVGGSETMQELRKRAGAFLRDVDAAHEGKTILVVTHGDPAWLMRSILDGLSLEETVVALEQYPKNAEVIERPFIPLPWNAEFEVDLHRPYIDSIVLQGSDGAPLTRISEVVDCWLESGSMPFAQHHTLGAPVPQPPVGDFIAEYIAQTRTWFYYMHVMGVALFNRQAFKAVVSTGTILAGDGSKMSKSKGNYTDPLENLDKYGADAFRYYVMAAPVMHAEDFSFRDEDLREAHNRIINMFWNSYQFYALYKDSVPHGAHSPRTHLLDRWIMARLDETVNTMTDAMDAYDLPRACKSMRDMIDDYSTWYVRRSRERAKGSGAADTLATQREVLLTLAKLSAPIMPFIAESVYRGVLGEGSVHLQDWPKTRAITDEAKSILSGMVFARTFVTFGLTQRSAAGIKVRQPLTSLRIKHDAPAIPFWDNFAEIIKEELNVKEVILEKGDGSDEPGVVLDTHLTPALVREGYIRDLIRAVQELRKEADLKPSDKVTLSVQTGDSEDMKALVEEARSELSRVAGVGRIEYVERVTGKTVFPNLVVALVRP